MTLSLRPAALDDAQRIFAWRNSEEVRRVSLTEREIEWGEHLSWLRGVLANPERHLLIAEQDGVPVGVLRFDVAEEDAEVSVFLAPGLSGKGLGTAVLQSGVQWAKERLAGVARLKARIRAGNEASLRVFGKAGFSEAYRVFELNMAGDQ